MAKGLPNIRVPRRAVPTMQLLSSLNDQSRESLLQALGEVPVALSTTELQSRVARAISKNDADPAAEGIISELFSLAALVDSHGYTTGDVAEVIASSPELSLEDDSAAALANLLVDLLESEAVRTLGKASDVAKESERIVHTVRLLTDIRPIFREPEDEPIGAVIVHKLRMSFHHGGQLEEIEFGLNSSDLTDLIEVLKRGEKKQQSAERLLNRFSLPAFIIEEPEGR